MSADGAYERELRELQIVLARRQAWAIRTGAKALVILEGRVGEDGMIARITGPLAPRNTRVVSLTRPSRHERSERCFQRHVRRLPARRDDPLEQPEIGDLDNAPRKKRSACSAARDRMLERAARSGPGVAPPDPEVLFEFEDAALTDGRLAK